MRRKLGSIVLLGALSMTGLAVAGCASERSDAPYALTGRSDRQNEMREQKRFTDDKGHYRPEWRSGSNADQHARF